MPTTLLQVPRRTFWRLRVLPQVSRHLLWRLRESRKSSGICFDVCGKSRKSPGICFGVCGSSASLAAFTLAFAEVPQVSWHLLWRLRGVPQVLRRTCWPLQHAINDVLNKGISFFCRTHVVQHRYQAIQGQSVREKDTIPAIHALLHVRRSTQTDLHPDKTRANPTKHLG